MQPMPDLLRRHPQIHFLVDEAFIGMAGESVAHLVPRYPNLLVTRTLSKAHSLAGFRVGYGIFPGGIAHDLNHNNDAYPLSRPSQAAAIATLARPDRIRERAGRLRDWTEDLAEQVRALGVRVFPSQTYFFLADFAPRDAATIARELGARGILVRPLGDRVLGCGFMRLTTARPEDNRRFLHELREVLRHGPSSPL
jgi:histidinol-phosphate aminotransferase